MSKGLKNTLIKSALIVALNTVAAFIYCIYSGKTSIEGYSSVLFLMGIAYIAVGAFPVLGSYAVQKDFTYQQVSTVMNDNYEKRRKIDNLLLDKNFLFFIKSGSIGAVTLLISFLLTI